MIKSEDLPNFSYILGLWRKACEETPSQAFDPQIYKHVTEIKNYSEINIRFKELLLAEIRKNIAD